MNIKIKIIGLVEGSKNLWIAKGTADGIAAEVLVKQASEQRAGLVVSNQHISKIGRERVIAYTGNVSVREQIKVGTTLNFEGVTPLLRPANNDQKADMADTVKTMTELAELAKSQMETIQRQAEELSQLKAVREDKPQNKE